VRTATYLAFGLALAVATWPQPRTRAAPRCYPTNRFVVLDGGLVRDTLTSLVWQQQASLTTMTWAAAQAHCSLGFRLPTVKELSSIVDFTGSPAIDQIAFPNTPQVNFWTSSLSATYSGRAWYVDFDTGYTDDYYGRVDETYRVRCVR
jgi:hypothetical protein